MSIERITFLLTPNDKACSCNAIIHSKGNVWALDDYKNFTPNPLHESFQGSVTTLSLFIQKFGVFPMSIICVSDPFPKLQNILGKFTSGTCVDTMKILCNMYDENMIKDVIYYMDPDTTQVLNNKK